MWRLEGKFLDSNDQIIRLEPSSLPFLFFSFCHAVDNKLPMSTNLVCFEHTIESLFTELELVQFGICFILVQVIELRTSQMLSTRPLDIPPA